MEPIVVFYLFLMFTGLYMLSFFVILTIRNKEAIFSYPKIKKFFSVSVLVPVYNEEKSVEQTIKHLLNLNYPKNKIEIILLNDGSTDKTKEIIEKYVKKYNNIKMLNKENSGKADSLNQGIKLSNGELFAVVDSDSFPSKNSLKKLVGYFENPMMGAVTSFVTIRNKNNFFARLQSLEYIFLGWARKLFDFVEGVGVTNGPLSLYRKKYVEEIGGFDTKTVTEDLDITWNLLAHNYKVSMCFGAKVSTITPDKFRPWLRQRIRWGLGGLQALIKYRKEFFKKGKGMFGFFIIPFLVISVFIAIFSFLFLAYINLKNLLKNGLIAGYSLSSGTSIFHLSNINFSPSIFIFYLFILLIVSLVYYNYILNKVNYEKNISFFITIA
ncbi:MAG: glycosyltransferase, partial [Nanoarchaeota archaeon]|nr:glycosyltransferase [Nanoarchaeota archaeon]